MQAPSGSSAQVVIFGGKAQVSQAKSIGGFLPKAISKQKEIEEV
jgi:hypothetical protein